MGFGLLFAGYATLLFCKLPFAVIAMAIGAYGMSKALTKLEQYGEGFKKASLWSGVLAVYYALYTLIWIASATGLAGGIFKSNVFILIDDLLYYAVLLVFHVYLYKALYDISEFCGFKKGIKKTYMSRVLMAMFYVFAVINAVFTFLGIQGYIAVAHFISQIVWIIYTALFIYSCYMSIATDEIIAEEEKKIAEYDAKYGYKRKNKKSKDKGTDKNA